MSKERPHARALVKAFRRLVFESALAQSVKTFRRFFTDTFDWSPDWDFPFDEAKKFKSNARRFLPRNRRVGPIVNGGLMFHHKGHDCADLANHQTQNPILGWIRCFLPRVFGGRIFLPIDRHRPLMIPKHTRLKLPLL